MANIKSAIKRVDTNNKKRENNQAQKSEMRTKIKRVEKLVAANDVENAKLALQETTKHIDKAIQKGVIHQNNGDRQKSRIANMVNSISA
ncbi:30S ribosomal protein S20 [Virgibacillus sp. NKC19-3]|uniref:30S ribosomal protein S20 n=1 Tax=Virgibacillus saliphilus TaxID=2831674 RepID=UPI001C9B58CA|nr:30S ribosomal protein S20 [Virgibacillus sp. NKC19-3]MBY7143330.1 30S ribosomal protein S20 [Virgibacillus sp. NKC19-3]